MYDPDVDGPIVINTRPAESPTPELPSLIATQKNALQETFRQSGISLASYSLEILSVARLAAAEGDYMASLKGYELIGKHIGALSETHNHLHLHNQQNQTDLRTVPDTELRALIESARQESAIQLAQLVEAPQPTTATIENAPAAPDSA